MAYSYRLVKSLITTRLLDNYQNTHLLNPIKTLPWPYFILHPFSLAKEMCSSKKPSSLLALLLALNLLFFSLVSAQPVVPAPSPTPTLCPRGPLPILSCVGVLGFLNITVGNPIAPCCTLIRGLTDAQASSCLCTAISFANFVSIRVNLSAVLNRCNQTAPAGTRCPI